MIQPLHIARKDARHLWPETLVSIALLAAYAYMSSKSWPTSTIIDPSPFVTGLLGFLIPVSWLVLISRLVHDEELVGDRQFWTTRPYTWYGLLGAKLLYLVVTVLLPFAIMQAWMLHHAGLYPTHNLGGILTRVEFVTLVVLLPLIAIAAVTATFVRYMVSALGGLLYVLAIVVFTAYKFGDKMAAPYMDLPIGILAIGLIAATIFVQYALRKTLIARLLLVAMPLALLVLTALIPANALVSHRYPDTAPGKITFAPQLMPPPQSTAEIVVVRDQVLIQLPVQLEPNSPTDFAYIGAQSYRVTLEGSGVHYTSGWTPARSELFGRITVIPFAIPKNIYDQARGKTLALHLELGTQTFTFGKPYSVNATESAFPIPGNAMCKLQDGALECSAPFKPTEVANITGTVQEGECAAPGPRSAVASGNFENRPGIPGISPVTVESAKVNLGGQPIPLCPNTPITFATTTAGAYGRLHLDVPAVTLDAFVRRIPRKTPGAQDPEPQPAENQ